MEYGEVGGTGEKAGGEAYMAASVKIAPKTAEDFTRFGVQ